MNLATNQKPAQSDAYESMQNTISEHHAMHDRIAFVMWAHTIWLMLLTFGLVFFGMSYANGQQPADEIMQIRLGHRLFFAKVLSANGDTSCATCHKPENGYSDGRPKAVGTRGLVGNRHTPTNLNAALSLAQFWDGRTIGINVQGIQPLTNPLEMGPQSRRDVLNRLRADPSWVQRFRMAYGPNSRITMAEIGNALGAFQGAILVSNHDTPLDLHLSGQRPDAGVGRRWRLFQAKGCAECHPYPEMTSKDFENIGTGWRFDGGRDDGRAAALGDDATPKSVRAFKVPSLREVGRRAPYMHNGMFPDLLSVIEHFSRGGARADTGTVDPRQSNLVQRQNFTIEEMGNLVHFLQYDLASPTYPFVLEP